MTPKALDPDATVTFTACGATFTTRYLTARQQLKVAALLDDAVKSGDNTQYVQALCEAIAVGMESWNLGDGPSPVTPDGLMDTFSIEELGDIFTARREAVTLADDEKKD